MIKARYLEAQYHRELGGRLVYGLSERTFREFIRGRADCDFRGQLKSENVLHDLDLVEIRHRLKSFATVTDYWCENVLRSGVELPNDELQLALKQFRFDAVLGISRHTENHHLPLEYERSVKFASRYRSYFKRLYASPQIAAVLFVCRDRKVESYVQQREKAELANSWPKTFYATLGEVLTSTESLAFSNLNGEKITLS